MMKIEGLKDALPYLQRFRGKTFVVKLGGSLLDDGETLTHIAKNIGVLWHLGIKMVVVHGGGPRLEHFAARMDIPQTKIGGRRVTTQETLELAEMVLGGLVNTELVTAIQKQGVSCVGLTGVDSQSVLARKRPPVSVRVGEAMTQAPVDFGYVGDIQAVRTTLFEHLWVGDYLPVVSSLSVDSSGQVLNTNADTVAKEIAVALKAEKLLFLTNQAGLLKNVEDPNSLVPYIDLEGLSQMVQKGEITGGMLPKIESCADAIKRGVERVHILSGEVEDSLLTEIFTNEGSGTLLVRNASHDGQME